MSGSRRWTQDAARMASVVALAAVALGCQSSESFSQTGGGRFNCYANTIDMSDPNRVVEMCRRVIEDPKARRNNQELANAQHHLGRAYLELRQYGPAVEMLDTALRTNPGRDDTRLALAKALREGANKSRQPSSDVSARDYLRAIDLLKLVIENEPRQRPLSLAPEAKYELGRIYLERGEPGDRDTALRFFNDARAAFAPASRSMKELALRLGDEAFNAAATRETMQRAVSMYESASDADRSDASTFLKLGEARMKLAGLDGPRGLADYGCEAGVGNVATLELARSAFSSATSVAPTNAEAYAKQACVLQALGRYSEASQYYRDAVRVSGESRTYRLKYGQSLMLEGKNESDPQVAKAKSEAAIGIFNAVLAQAASDKDRADAYVELASAYNSIGATANASASAERAINLKTDSAVPYLIAGKIEYGKVVAGLADSAVIADTEERSNPNDPRKRFRAAYERSMSAAVNGGDYKKASSLLAEAVTIAARSTEGRTRDTRSLAEALYFQSNLEDLKLRRGVAASIDIADRANANGKGDRRYQEQACLSRIAAGAVLDNTAQALCTGGDSRSEPAALVLEGTYYLRRGMYWSRLAGRDEWENAYAAFDRGYRALEQVRDPAVNELRSRLLVGRGLAHFCIGFENLGERAIYGDPAENTNNRDANRLRAAARGWYVQYGAYGCSAAPPATR